MHPLSENTKTVALLASVFVTGMAVLIIEITALRILSPYYGNTIYTTSSVIGVILAALSLGYYAGGKIADARPHYALFYTIIFVAGLLVLLMDMISGGLLQIFSAVFSIAAGSFFSALLLFFTPALLLGTLSPIAIKLQANSLGRVGNSAGGVFFWSTLGSIVGTMLSGFFLIPMFGIAAIIVTTGIILGCLGLLGLLFFVPTNKKVLFVMVAVFAIIVAAVLLAQTMPIKSNLQTVYEKDGTYEKIKIADGTWNGQPARFLFQDRSYSAAMYKNSDNLVYDYTKYYALYKLINPQATQAFAIGGGGYSIPKALLNDSPNMHVDVTEIEPELYAAAKTYFNLPETDRLANYTEDGRRFLAKTNKTYDIIIGDAYYSFFSIPAHLTTKEFFTLAKTKLQDNGVFIGNFAGYLAQEKQSFILSEMRTFKNVFPNSYFFAVNSPNSDAAQNIIFLGINGTKKIDFTNLKDLAQKNIDPNRFDFSKAQEITDDYAPVEYLVSKILGHWY